MRFKTLIFVLMIAFSAIFMGMIGTSYAYYAVSDGTKMEITTGNINTDVAVVFKQSQYINLNTGIPLDSSSKNFDDLVSKSEFSFEINDDVVAGDAMITIGITDLLIDDELRVEDFKYNLYCYNIYFTTSYPDRAMVLTNEYSGTGVDFTDDIINTGYFKIATLEKYPGTFDFSCSCTLKMWFEETGEDQNDLMNKKFRGLIKVNTLFRNE